MTDGAPTRLVLHVGAPKTGTTYLQSMLWRNRRPLARAGVHLPGSGPMDHLQAGRDVLEWRRPANHPLPPWEGTFDRLVDEIRRSGAHTGVISSEDLVRATAAQVERTFARLDGFVVDVVYGTRSFAAQLTSQWQESVRNSGRRDLPDWLDEYRREDPAEWFWRVNDLPTVADRWRPPSGRVHVLGVPGRDAPDDELWRRFLQVVDVERERTRPIRRSNESFGYVEASLLLRVQRHLPPRAPRIRIRDVVKGFLLREVLVGRPDRVPITLPDGERPWVEDVTEQRREFLRTADVEFVGELHDLADADTSFGALSLDGRGSEVAALVHDTVAALLAFEDRQRRTLRWLEKVSRLGSAPTGAVGEVRSVTDFRAPVVRRRHYRRAAAEMLAPTIAPSADPVVALDAGSEVVAGLLLEQGRRSRRIQEVAGPVRGPLMRRLATFVRR